MDLHVVRPGDTLYGIAREYGVSMDRLLQDNQLPDPSQLVVGQVILVRYPALTHVVKEGDTLWSVARSYQVSPDQLLRNNPGLRGLDRIFPGQALVIRYQGEPQGTLSVNAYAYPSIDKALLTATLPYLSQLTPFTFQFTADGALLPPEDGALTQAALQAGVAPIFHLSSLSDGGFSGELVHQLLSDETARDRLIAAVAETARAGGYRGVDVDFEFVYGLDAGPYADFLARLRRAVSPLPLTVALAPKQSDGQAGRLYEGLDFSLLAQSVDFALLMAYDWGWAGGPPGPVSPLPQVRRSVEYALTYFPPERLMLGVPNYGYDWPLPYREGNRAVSVDHVRVVRLAWNRHAAIRWDQEAQAPWFPYVDGEGRRREVWFEDARSWAAKIGLALDYGLAGIGVWNLDRPFPQGWAALSSLAEIRPGLSG